VSSGEYTPSSGVKIAAVGAFEATVIVGVKVWLEAYWTPSVTRTRRTPPPHEFEPSKFVLNV
jgi:hypothetical protein